WGAEAFFPLRCARKSQLSPVACPSSARCRSRGFCRAELARRVSQDPSLPPISASTVGRWLKADRIRPWRYHAWQHIHDPHVFLERARPVLHMYAKAQALLRTGTWLVCLDEKTSFQAREGEQPHRPARQGQTILQESCYSL